MIVVDTSIWIEFLKGNSTVSPLLSSQLEKGEILAFEPVFGELMQGAKNKRELDIILSYWTHLPKFSIDCVFINTGKESGHKNWLDKGVGLIDAALLHYARDHHCKIWTLDKKLLSIMDYNEKVQ